MSERQIRVTGTGHISVAPDTTVLTFSLSELCREYHEAVRRSAELTQKLRGCITAAGLNTDDLKTTRFDVRPVYNTEYSTERDLLLKKKTKAEQILSGYRFTHALKLEFANDNKKLSAVLGELHRSNTGAEFDFEYTVKDPEAARSALLREAARVSRVNAQALAEASGAELGEVIDINYSWDRLNLHVRPMKRMKCCDSSPAETFNIDIAPDDIDLEESVTITWALK